ncbi:MAG: hypothetical protein IT291_01135 [Deltaproteobacteria bacterium]|nr:hypothetical protein [Deltaproteobacteria bacterium]
MRDEICIIEANENNLARINCFFSRNALNVVTGPSGSGKTSLVFDVLCREAQWRFFESSLSRSKNIAVSLKRPDVKSISGLSFVSGISFRDLPSPFATLSTLTRIYEYLRLIFYYCGAPHCLNCGAKLSCHSRRDMCRFALTMAKDSAIAVIVRFKKVSREQFREKCKDFGSKGFSRIRLGKKFFHIDDALRLKINEPQLTFSLVIDVIPQCADNRSEARIIEALETALSVGGGEAFIAEMRDSGEKRHLSELLRCKDCELVQRRIELAAFSYHNPHCACDTCRGSGFRSRHRGRHGAAEEKHCPDCGGARVGVEARHYRLLDRSFAQVVGDSVDSLLIFAKQAESQLGAQEHFKRTGDSSSPNGERMPFRESFDVLRAAAKELIARASNLSELGLGYLELNRPISSLSKGELQRAQLARVLNNGMSGIVYALDEPTLGLHPKDTTNVVRVLERIISLGNTAIVIEHDFSFVAHASHVLSLGPGGGTNGGRVVFSGNARDYLSFCADNERSTPKHEAQARIEDTSRVVDNLTSVENPPCLSIKGAKKNNLKNLDCVVPLNRLAVICGVSGSGKTSLIAETIAPAIKEALRVKKGAQGLKLIAIDWSKWQLESISGFEGISRVVDSWRAARKDNRRSVVATAIGVMLPLRGMFARTVGAKMRGFSNRHFSFNLIEGACMRCKGIGVEKSLAESGNILEAVCEDCRGRRYRPELEEIRYRNLSIQEVLDLNIEQAFAVFQKIEQIGHPLSQAIEVGLGYLKLSEPTASLSFGEYNRLMLARDILSRSLRGRNSPALYIFDEPSEGLHRDEISLLIKLFRRLVNAGNTVLLIEHNTHIISEADFILELGPGAGRSGGEIIASGSKKEVMESHHSLIRQYLKNN